MNIFCSLNVNDIGFNRDPVLEQGDLFPQIKFSNFPGINKVHLSEAPTLY